MNGPMPEKGRVARKLPGLATPAGIGIFALNLPTSILARFLASQGDRS